MIQRIILVSMALIYSSLIAQEKEIDMAYDKAKSADFTGALEELKSIESTVESNSNKIDFSTLLKYYYATGMANLQAGDTHKGGEYLAKLTSLQLLPNKKYYTIKNKDTKEFTYSLNEKELEDLSKTGNYSSVKSKEIVLSPELLDYQKLVNTKYIEKWPVAEKAFNADQDYEKAGPLFEELYYLRKALGDDNPTILYYAAVSYQNSKNYSKANTMYEDLINQKYTGVKEQYFIVDKKTGEEQSISQDQIEIFSKDPNQRIETRKTESIASNLYRDAVNSFIAADEKDKAIWAAKKGVELEPDNKALQELLSITYYNTGHQDEFVQAMKKRIAANPNDHEAYVNLGVIYTSDKENRQQAIEYFDKALSIDPTNKNAYNGAVKVFYEIDNDLVEKMKALGTSAAENDKFIKYRDERNDWLKKSLPYLEKLYQLDTTDEGIKSYLKDVYRKLKMKSKADALN